MTDLVGHVTDRPARDRRAPLLILRNLELSYEQRSGAINKKEEQLEQGRVYQRIMFLSLTVEFLQTSPFSRVGQPYVQSRVYKINRSAPGKMTPAITDRTLDGIDLNTLTLMG